MLYSSQDKVLSEEFVVERRFSGGFRLASCGSGIETDRPPIEEIGKLLTSIPGPQTPTNFSVQQMSYPYLKSSICLLRDVDDDVFMSRAEGSVFSEYLPLSA